MTTAALSDILNFYRFPAGRRIYALRKTLELLEAGDPLAAKIDASISIDRNALDKQTRWQAIRDAKISWPKEVIELDHEHDRLWGALSGMCSSLAVGLGDESEQGAAAGRLDKTLFSSGVTAIIHLAFVEQRETTAAWLDRLQGELKADVELAGVSGFVQKLADVNARFGELLDKREEASGLSYGDVKSAEEKGHVAFLQVVAMLVGREAENDAERARLLDPILKQNEAIGLMHKRRRNVPDVNPDTGEVTDPPVES